MSSTAYLILENGMVFEGRYFGAQGEITGEVVFTTGMAGYLETLTDQSYHGQIVLQTFPLIGNYGVISSDFESAGVGPAAYIVKHPCQDPSNFRSEGDLDTFLRQRNVVGLCGIDTRALTKIIRENGVMNGRITGTKPDKADIGEIKAHGIQNAVREVSPPERKLYKAEGGKYTVALFDFGVKESVKLELLNRGCDVWALPYNCTPEDVLSLSPDGIVLSNGPGDPAENTEIIKNLKSLIKTDTPIFGICLGHQLLALANGFKTHKLKYGHRGENQPVKDTQSGRVYITSQNHGYSVKSESIDGRIASEAFVNLNDGTCEGIFYKNSPAFSVQFYPESGSATENHLDTAFLFDRFVQNMEVKKHAAR